MLTVNRETTERIENVEKIIAILPEVVLTVSGVCARDFEFGPVLEKLTGCKEHIREKGFPLVSLEMNLDSLMECFSKLDIDGIAKYREQLKELLAPYETNDATPKR